VTMVGQGWGLLGSSASTKVPPNCAAIGRPWHTSIWMGAVLCKMFRHTPPWFCVSHRDAGVCDPEVEFTEADTLFISWSCWPCCLRGSGAKMFQC
jgi:hypothetical protein